VILFGNFYNCFAQSKTPQIPTIDFCQIGPAYNGKVVRVRAIYISGFEKSSLSSPACYVPNLTWVDFEISNTTCDSKKQLKKLKKARYGQGVDVVFVGRFENDKPGGYGHMDMYATRFVVTCVEAVKSLGSCRSMPEGKK
jgi:hypothetical protein